jgi:hypothetical protein
MPFSWASYADRDEANMQKEIDIVIDSMAVQLFLHFRKRKIDVMDAESSLPTVGSFLHSSPSTKQQLVFNPGREQLLEIVFERGSYMTT